MNKVYAGLLCVLLSGALHAQGVSDRVNITSIQPYTLAVSDVQTTNLIFPYAVRRVHCASRELEIEQMKDVRNILLVRSTAQGFSPTNLSVVTTDGKFYSFCLEYATEPSILNVRFQNDSSYKVRASIAEVDVNEAMIEASCGKVEKQPRFIKLLKRNQQVKLNLDGIFIHNNLMWFAMTLKNFSLINYQVDYVKVFIRDRTRSRKTIVQEKEMQPVYVKMDENIDGSAASRIIMAFEPFTIPFNKILAIQMAEKTGGRFIELRAANHVFYKTRAILE